jgi:hypothetical protein
MGLPPLVSVADMYLYQIQYTATKIKTQGLFLIITNFLGLHPSKTQANKGGCDNNMKRILWMIMTLGLALPGWSLNAYVTIPGDAWTGYQIPE